MLWLIVTAVTPHLFMSSISINFICVLSYSHWILLLLLVLDNEEVVNIQAVI